MVGVASIFPFLSVASSPEIMQTNAYLLEIKNFTQFSDNQLLIFLGALSLSALIINQLFRLISSWY